MELEKLKYQLTHPEDETALFSAEEIEANKIAAILASFPMLFWMPLVMAKDSAYGKFCANQGLMLFIMFLIIGAARKFLFPILRIVPVLGGIAVFILKLLFLAVSLGGFVFLLVNACQGKAKRLPLVGRLLEAFS